MFGLRLGTDPRVVVTTTPRPTKLIRELLGRAGKDVVVTRGSTYENRANLTPGFFEQVIRKYEGARLGRQEFDAEVLEDVPGALWSREGIEAVRHQKALGLVRSGHRPGRDERRGRRRDRHHRRRQGRPRPRLRDASSDFPVHNACARARARATATD